MSVDLSRTHRGSYEPGRSYIVRALWLVCEALLFSNPLVVSFRFKVWLLRRFGARVGDGVIIKPGAKVKYPWRLAVGDHCWIGERSWIDNMENVVCGAHVVVSQGAYVCTGNHDWTDPGMPLSPKPVYLDEGVWVGAFARIAPGVRMAEGSVAALGAVVIADTSPFGIYVGNPAERVSTRVIRERDGLDSHLVA